MAELALTSSPNPPPVALAANYTWLTVDQVAQLTGLHEGRVRHKCGSEWAAQGLARTVRREGKRPQWEIRSDADPRLMASVQAIVPVGPAQNALARTEQIRTGDLVKNSAAMARAQFKAGILARWDQALRAARVLNMKADTATAAFMLELQKEFAAKGLGKCPNRATLYNWQRAAKSGEGIEGLADGRQTRRNPADASNDPFFQFLKRLWGNTNQPKLSKCYDLTLYMAREQGWEIRSRSQSRRFIASMDRREKILLREGKEAFVNEVTPHQIGDYSTVDSNEIWVSDHHEFDVMVKVGEKLVNGAMVPIHKRLWLTVWMDMRSRKIVAWKIRVHAPNTDVILETLALGCQSHYVPFGVYTDNGKDYDSRVLTGQTKKQYQANRGKRKGEIEVDETRLAGIYAALRVKHQHAIPYHPQSKPVERFFGTVCDRFSRMWPTYCGNSPENRPEGLDGPKGRLARGLAPTTDEFIEAFGKWVEADYHHRIHTGDSMNDTPANVWQANLRTKRTAPRELLDLLLQPRIECRVHQLGITHQKLTYGRYLLNSLVGQDIYIRVNNADVSSVSVWSARDEFICIAPSNAPLPRNADSEAVRAAIKEQRHHAKVLTETYRSQLRRHYDVPMLMIAAAVEEAEAMQAKNPLPALPEGATIQPIRTDLEGQLQALQAAQETPLRLVGGADEMGGGGTSLDAAAAAYGGDDE